MNARPKPETVRTLDAVRRLALDYDPAKYERPYVKLHREPWMDLSAELLSRSGRFEHWSFAHYGEQNGDLMADPEMELLRVAADAGSGQPARWLPVNYRNDYVGVNRPSMELDFTTLAPRGWWKHSLADAVDFLDTWAANIREQQEVPA